MVPNSYQGIEPLSLTVLYPTLSGGAENKAERWVEIRKWSFKTARSAPLACPTTPARKCYSKISFYNVLSRCPLNAIMKYRRAL